MNDLLQNLLKLQALEFNETKETDPAARIEELRKSIPLPILGHFDRLVARGKKGVAIVRNQVCTGCHMRLPIGTINTLLQRQDIQLCDSCGRYLYIPEQTEAPVAEPAPAAPPKPKRKRKAALATTPA